MKKNFKAVIAFVALLSLFGGALTVLSACGKTSASSQAVTESEKTKLSKAEKALTLAYKTRAGKDITAAQKAIDKLNSADKKKEEKSLTELKSMLSQLSSVQSAVAKYKKSHNQKDAQAAQNLINKMTESYLAKDKTNEQNQLNSLIKANKGKPTQPSSSAKASSSSQASSSSSQASKAAAGNSANTAGGNSNSGSNQQANSAPASNNNGSSTARSSSSQAAPAAAQVTVKAGYSKTCTISSGESLLTLVKEQMGASATPAGFITSVGSLSQNTAKHYYIEFWVNGSYSQVGAASVVLHNGDSVTFHLINITNNSTIE